MNGSVQSVAFNADGSRMFTAGGSSRVVIVSINVHLHVCDNAYFPKLMISSHSFAQMMEKSIFGT